MSWWWIPWMVMLQPPDARDEGENAEVTASENYEGRRPRAKTTNKTAKAKRKAVKKSAGRKSAARKSARKKGAKRR